MCRNHLFLIIKYKLNLDSIMISKKLKKELLRAIDIQENNKKFYKINKNGNTVILKLNNIYYFEVNHRKVNVYEKDDVRMIIHGKLKEEDNINNIRASINCTFFS